MNGVLITRLLASTGSMALVAKNITQTSSLLVKSSIVLNNLIIVSLALDVRYGYSPFKMIRSIGNVLQIKCYRGVVLVLSALAKSKYLPTEDIKQLTFPYILGPGIPAEAARLQDSLMLLWFQIRDLKIIERKIYISSHCIYTL